MQLAKHGAEDLAAAAQHGGRDKGVAAHADVEGRGGGGQGVVEAVRRVEVRGVDCDAVAEGAQGEGGVEDQTLGAADAEVRVQEDDASARLLLACGGGRGGRGGGGRH